jgi:hypothetical protein
VNERERGREKEYKVTVSQADASTLQGFNEQ